MTPIINTQTVDADEAALVERAKHDPLAFGALYDRYVDRIYGYALRETRNATAAQDVTSATFERALRHIRRFHPGANGIAPWLYRIARNEIIQLYRRDKRLSILDGDPVTAGDKLLQSGRPIELTLLSVEREHDLYAALTQLSATDRDVLTLRFLEQLPTESIAQLLDCSRDNVYVRLHRALGRLRGLLANEEK
jgi:RNA polymerase sigma-70 factor (ECF subfamily)